MRARAISSRRGEGVRVLGNRMLLLRIPVAQKRGEGPPVNNGVIIKDLVFIRRRGFRLLLSVE